MLHGKVVIAVGIGTAFAVALLLAVSVVSAAEPPAVAEYQIEITSQDHWTGELREKLQSAAEESESAGVFKFRITGIELSDDVTRSYSHAILDAGWYIAARLSKDPKQMYYRSERIPPVIRDADLRIVRDISSQVAQTLLYAAADMAKTESDKPCARTAKLILDKSVDRRISLNPETKEYTAQLYIKGTGKRIDLGELTEGRIVLR